MKYIFFALALAGCAAPPTVFRPVTVDVPVPQPCAVQKIAPPDFALDHIDPKTGLGGKMQALLATLDQHKAYEQKLNAQLALCP